MLIAWNFICYTYGEPMGCNRISKYHIAFDFRNMQIITYIIRTCAKCGKIRTYYIFAPLTCICTAMAPYWCHVKMCPPEFLCLPTPAVLCASHTYPLLVRTVPLHHSLGLWTDYQRVFGLGHPLVHRWWHPSNGAGHLTLQYIVIQVTQNFCVYYYTDIDGG